MALNIKYDIRGRQTGKTTDLIKRSAETDHPIITKDNATCRYLKERAKEMGLTIPDPISFNAVMNNRDSVYKGKTIKDNQVLVDEAEIILNTYIHKQIHCDIDMLTMVSRNAKGHELLPDGRDLNEVYGLGD